MFVAKEIILSLAFCMATANAWATQSFKSVSAVTPVFNVTKSGEPLAPGYLFLTTTALPPVGGYSNLNVQTLNKKPVLIYWNGSGSPNSELLGHGYGSVQILDSTYTIQQSICPDLDLVVDGLTEIDCQADLHESYVTERGSLLVTGYNLTQADLTSVNGSADGWVYDSLFFEIDFKNKEILFQWSALESGIPISNTKQLLGSSGTESDPFDFFHINSIQSVGSGYLINSRHMWTTFILDSKGEVQWHFEGSTGGDFTLPPNINFAWEHHARVLNVTHSSVVLHMFNNANSEPPLSGVNQTLGLMFSLDLNKKTSTLLKDLYDSTQTLYTDSQGALNLLPNGNVLMGYGQIPIIKEYGPGGDVRMSIQFGDLDGTQSSYRAYRLHWEGVPAADPTVFAMTGHAYMSWNGATCVQR